MRFSSVSILLMIFELSAISGEVLFSDDFSSGELESRWIFYGDPLPGILDSMGTPPPCFINNGDAMYGSGAISRNIYAIGEGLCVECDIYLECDERGAWVSASLAIVTPGYRNGRTPTDHQITYILMSYLGELDWQRPHLQCELKFGVFDNPPERFTYVQSLYHQNHLLNSWHSYRLVIDEKRCASLYIDDSLFFYSSNPIPDSIESIRVRLGDRSSDWGIALHDNLVVYRP